MKFPMETIEILLVEDNPDDAMLAMMALKESRIVNNIIHLKDGAEALDFIFHEGVYSDLPEESHPKVILLDIKMPKVNGIEVLRRVKADDKTREIPIVIFTSSDEDPDVEECYRLGVNSYVVKPLDFDQFKKVINDIGLYWVVLNRPFE
ncbi:MAG: response regulator [Bacteroidota bacterium]